MKITLEQSIEEIENKKEYAIEKQKEVPSSHYWEGYYAASGELLEFIENNR